MSPVSCKAVQPAPVATGLLVEFECREHRAVGPTLAKSQLESHQVCGEKKIPYNIRESDAFNSLSRKTGGRLEQAIKGKVLKIGSSPGAEWEAVRSQNWKLPGRGLPPGGCEMGSPNVSTMGFL